MMDQSSIAVRPAYDSDRQQLTRLIRFGSHVHRHLDWRRPIDWMGTQPYLVAELEGQVVAVLACPDVDHQVAWIRLFAVEDEVPRNQAWGALWKAAQSVFSSNQIRVVAIPMHAWFEELLVSSGFAHINDVVILVLEPPFLQSLPSLNRWKIRAMEYEDLPEVQKVDAAAFDLVWQIPHDLLRDAFTQATIASVAVSKGEIIGYQISTAYSDGGHLARLAVDPGRQGQGVGFALVQGMLDQFRRAGALKVTVNTQADNLASLALYQKTGFQHTEEIYPVYQVNF